MSQNGAEGDRELYLFDMPGQERTLRQFATLRDKEGIPALLFSRCSGSGWGARDFPWHRMRTSGPFDKLRAGSSLCPGWLSVATRRDRKVQQVLRSIFRYAQDDQGLGRLDATISAGNASISSEAIGDA